MAGELSRQQRRLLSRKGSSIIIPGEEEQFEEIPIIRVMIGIPTVGAINPFTQTCIDKLKIDLRAANLPLEIKQHTAISSLLPWARNDVVEEFLNCEPLLDYLLFIDSDMMFHPMDLPNFLQAKGDIMSAAYVQKQKPHLVNAAHLSPENIWVLMSDGWQEGGVVEVDGVGMGFCLISREVFETMEYPWFDIPVMELKEPKVEKWGTKRYHMWGEDFSFCHKAKEIGFKVHVDLNTWALHVGSYNYGPDDLIAHLESGYLEKNKKDVAKIQRTDM